MVFVFGVATPSGARSLLLALCSAVTPGDSLGIWGSGQGGLCALGTPLSATTAAHRIHFKELEMCVQSHKGKRNPRTPTFSTCSSCLEAGPNPNTACLPGTARPLPTCQPKLPPFSPSQTPPVHPGEGTFWRSHGVQLWRPWFMSIQRPLLPLPQFLNFLPASCWHRMLKSLAESTAWSSWASGRAE